MTLENSEKHKSDPIWRVFAHFDCPVIFGKNWVVCKWSTFCVILAIFVLSSKFYPNSGNFLFSSSFFVKICGQNGPQKMTVFVWHKCDPFCAKMRFLQYGQFLGFFEFVHLVDVFVIFEPVSDFFRKLVRFSKMCKNVSQMCAQKSTKKHTLKNAQENELVFQNNSQKQGPHMSQKSDKKRVHKCCVFAILSTSLSLVI